MFHITQTKSGRFMVVLLAKNKKVLSITEELNTRRACFTNIQAQIKAISVGACAEVQDDTKGIIYHVMAIGVEKTPLKPKPRYIPGKNPKKK